jgi:CRP-like cAMP-binding protein
MGRSTLSREATALRRTQLFSHLSDREVAEVMRLSTVVDVGADKRLTQQGTPGLEAFVVVAGSASCYIDGKKVATFGSGDVIGEVALLDVGMRTATVVTDTPMALLVFEAREFAGLLASLPALTRAILATLARRLRAVQSAL